jgi:CheY-like chemotaxis protein
MSFGEKLGVIELLLELMNKHENKLDRLVEQIEIIDQTIIQDPQLTKSIKEYNQETPKETVNKNILVVDDDEKLAHSFKLILETVGYNVDTAHTGQKALDKLKEKQYDLLLLDLNLPDMLGDIVAEEIEDNQYKTDIVFITGYTMLQKDHKKTLLKPIKPEHLIKTTKKVLQK